jgi:hypothetical protein
MDEIMLEQPFKVLVRVDSAGRVVAINSSAFVQDTDGWTEIDSGYGDRYHHAQGNYLPGPLMDDRGVYRYKLVDGAVVERTQGEMDADYTEPEIKPSIEARVETVEGETAELREALDLILSGVTE